MRCLACSRHRSSLGLRRNDAAPAEEAPLPPEQELVAAAPLHPTGRPAHQLRGEGSQRHAPPDRLVVPANPAPDDVSRPERGTGADPDRLLAHGEVQGTGDLPLAVGGLDPLLEPPGEQHPAVEPEPVLVAHGVPGAGGPGADRAPLSLRPSQVAVCVPASSLG